MNNSLLRKRNHWLRRALVLSLLMGIVLVCTWVFFHKDSQEDTSTAMPQHVVEPEDAYSDLFPEMRETLSHAAPLRISTTIDRGDSFYKILQENGISQSQAIDIHAATKDVFDLSKVLPGHEFVLVFTPDNQQLIGLEYVISDLSRLVVSIADDKIEASTQQIERIFNSAYSGSLKQLDFTIKQGDNLYDMLKGVGVCTYQIDSLIKSVRKQYNLSDLVPDHALSVWITEEDPPKLAKLCYEIDSLTYLDVEPDEGVFKASTRTLEVDVRHERAEGSIASSLYESAVKAGLSPEVVMELSDIFAWDINFFTDIRDGDTYTVLYETYFVEGSFKGYGRVVAARFINQGREHLAVYYDNGNGTAGYYDEQGKPIRKLFLKAPLNYRRISSGFTYKRKHPVFHVVRPHLGVDYAAPTGTPIVALGSGKIIFKGWSNGFGHSIQIKHPNGYVTYYGHLSRYARGIRKGKQVSQGDVIGYVGMTGVATGPHLDFRVKYNGKFINPLRLKPVTGPPLKGDSMEEFKAHALQRLSMLDDPSLNNTSNLTKIE
ncbi:MAG: peptidoglycan DD-metalloendopeptidase family protein [Desulfomonilia bacterium]